LIFDTTGSASYAAVKQAVIITAIQDPIEKPKTVEESDTLVINEIYPSLQGESTFAGLPCIFVRLTGCHLRCSYCDTAYAFSEGRRMGLADVCREVGRLAKPFRESVTAAAVTKPKSRSAVRDARDDPPPAEPALRTSNFALPLVEITGGEPLLQKNCLSLMKRLCDDGFTVLLETSGALDISTVDPRVRRIMDLKCPSSGEADRNRWENLAHLRPTDELKLVIGTRQDYEWAKRQMAAHRLGSICPLLFSWVHPLAPAQQHKSLKRIPAGQTPMSRRELAEQIIADALPVRFQIQMHKVIWPPDRRGV
jgi:7-carboxy-7-deazaguanine synthase